MIRKNRVIGGVPVSAINSDYRDRGKPLRNPTGLTPVFSTKNVFTPRNGLIFVDVSSPIVW